MNMWQPIETAPRNQTFLAVLDCAGEQTICTMRWPVAEAKNSRPDSKTFHVERVTHWMPLPDPPGAQAQPTPSVPECPYPCGWRNLLKHAIEDGAYLARSINEDEPVTENARAVTMRMVMRLRDVLMAVNNAAPEAKP